MADELFLKQMEEIKEYQKGRGQAWAMLKSEHTEIETSFGSADLIPETMKKKIEKDIADFNRDWSSNSPYRKAIADKHFKEKLERVKEERKEAELER